MDSLEARAIDPYAIMIFVMEDGSSDAPSCEDTGS
jgi:hypothetical protein